MFFKLTKTYILNKLVGFNYNDGSNTKKYIYHRNIQGDILGIYDDEGNQVGGYAYDAYGNHVVTLDINGIATLNPFRYRGYFYDDETKLYYLNARYYDPETGRFISPDILSILDETKGQINGFNLYMYCGNNPVMYMDPNGQSFILAFVIIGAILGAIGVGVYVGVTAYNNGVRGWDLVGQILLGALVGGIIGAVIGWAIGTGLTQLMAFAAKSWTIKFGMSALRLATNLGTIGVGGTITITVTGTQVITAVSVGILGLLRGTVMFSKETRSNDKEHSTDKPSWVNQDMVNPSKTAHQNATEIMNDKFGIGNWNKTTANHAFSKILKWINRHLFR